MVLIHEFDGVHSQDWAEAATVALFTAVPVYYFVSTDIHRVIGFGGLAGVVHIAWLNWLSPALYQIWGYFHPKKLT